MPDVNVIQTDIGPAAVCRLVQDFAILAIAITIAAGVARVASPLREVSVNSYVRRAAGQVGKAWLAPEGTAKGASVNGAGITRSAAAVADATARWA